MDLEGRQGHICGTEVTELACLLKSVKKVLQRLLAPGVRHLSLSVDSSLFMLEMSPGESTWISAEV